MILSDRCGSGLSSGRILFSPEKDKTQWTDPDRGCWGDRSEALCWTRCGSVCTRPYLLIGKNR